LTQCCGSNFLLWTSAALPHIKEINWNLEFASMRRSHYGEYLARTSGDQQLFPASSHCVSVRTATQAPGTWSHNCPADYCGGVNGQLAVLAGKCASEAPPQTAFASSTGVRRISFSIVIDVSCLLPYCRPMTSLIARMMVEKAGQSDLAGPSSMSC
jgi:hypothetical protein